MAAEQENEDFLILRLRSRHPLPIAPRSTRMEISKPTVYPLSRIVLFSTAVFLGLSPISSAQSDVLASRELAQRNSNVAQARELLEKGDTAYSAGRFSDAVAAYAAAHALIPAAPLTLELRAAAADRYAQAAVEEAKTLSRKGDIGTAKSLLDKVLAEDVAPAHYAARSARTLLDDPIRTNPALTPEHVRNIDEVRRTLYIAQGSYDLGKFSEAKRHFEKVLQIDPTNTAARRGLEKVAQAISQYQQSAKDQSRAAMLAEVAAAWETTVPPAETVLPPLSPHDASAMPASTITARLNRIIIPNIAFDSVNLFEAIDFLRARATDPQDPSPINYTINLGPAESEDARKIADLRFSLQLKNVPASRILQYITEATGTKFSVDDFSVIITPAGSTSEELITRTFRVPPDFLTTINSGLTGAAPASNDPFASSGNQSGGLITERLGAREALEKHGIQFPDGASAFYNASINSLRVTNTAANLDSVSQIIHTLTGSAPVMVSVSVTMIRTQKTNLEELGFDWLVNPFGASANNVFASGGTTGNGSPRTGADMINPVNGTAIDGIPADPSSPTRGMVTDGLRSGNYAINRSGIDNLINNLDRTGQSNSVAPGIMGVTGLFSDAQVQMLMRGLSQKKNVDIMARPSITTRSGQASSINLIREFIYPTEYEPPELPNSVGNTGDGLDGISGGSSGAGFPVTPATPTAFEKRDVGVALEVLPVADADKRYVDVTLNPSFSDFDGFVNYGSPINAPSSDALGNPVTATITQNRILMPIFSVQRANTQLTVLDGATIVIGGLMQDALQEVNDKVPVLGDLPLVGRLFQSKARQRTSTALIFLVHVELIDPAGRPYRER